MAGRHAAAALADLALDLGADLPMCLKSRAVFVGGIGEIIQESPTLPPCWLVLANPGEAVATPAVFKARAGPFSQMARFEQPPANAEALATQLASRGNDLMTPAIHLCPTIAEVLTVLDRLPGALLSRMSGSGATCFGLFADDADQDTVLKAYEHALKPYMEQNGYLTAECDQYQRPDPQL
ncbi:MAG: hypothetical protein HC826_00955 [Rhodospirillales bacterium]|nr:hypothetical protein [Rhodospirillales bacterium]